MLVFFSPANTLPWGSVLRKSGARRLAFPRQHAVLWLLGRSALRTAGGGQPGADYRCGGGIRGGGGGPGVLGEVCAWYGGWGSFVYGDKFQQKYYKFYFGAFKLFLDLPLLTSFQSFIRRYVFLRGHHELVLVFQKA